MNDTLSFYLIQNLFQTNKGYIQGFEADLETLAAHPHPADGFAGMEIRGDVLTDKENAGAALLDACKEVKTSDPVQPIYRLLSFVKGEPEKRNWFAAVIKCWRTRKVLSVVMLMC